MTKLYIGNLSFGVTDESLLRLFTEKGYQATSARVICDREGGRSRGFGFVELGEDAEKAISEMNGVTVDGRAIQVNEARPQEGRSGRHPSGGRSGGGYGRRSY